MTIFYLTGQQNIRKAHALIEAALGRHVVCACHLGRDDNNLRFACEVKIHNSEL
jgi:hypothetical protein